MAGYRVQRPLMSPSAQVSLEIHLQKLRTMRADRPRCTASDQGPTTPQRLLSTIAREHLVAELLDARLGLAHPLGVLRRPVL